MITFLKMGTYGRLGNQLFQVAATLGIADRSGHPAVFPEWSLGDWFDLNTRPTSWLAAQEWETMGESTFCYDAKLIDIPRNVNVSLEGYLQTEKYFSDCKHSVRAAIVTESVQRLADKVLRRHGISKENDACAVHVRRGDYLKFSDLFAQLSLEEYYYPAMDLIRENYGVKKFVVVSDDLQWCRENIKRPDVVFSRNVGTLRDRVLNSSRHRSFADAHSLRWASVLHRYECIRDLNDLMLMASCRHHIIANSSFSWWSSWLSGFPDRAVVAPNTWFKPAMGHDTRDLYRDEMIRI